MNKETLDLLKDLAAKLGTTADHLWSVLIRQAYVSFFCDLLLYFLIGGLIGIAYKLAKRLASSADEMAHKGEDDTLQVAGLIVTGIVTIILLLYAITNVGDTITKIANPEYWALQQVLDTVKGMK
jgi:uncharacterized membrane protein YqgA involved in biofilm formation